MNFGENVSKIMEIKGISQSELTRRTGIDLAHIGKILKGKPVAMATAEKIAEGLGEPLSILCGDEPIVKNQAMVDRLIGQLTPEQLDFIIRPTNIIWIDAMMQLSKTTLTAEGVISIVTAWRKAIAETSR